MRYDLSSPELIHNSQHDTEDVRSITAAVSVEFTLSSGVKAVAPAHAPAPAATDTASAASTSSHLPITNGPGQTRKPTNQQAATVDVYSVR